MLALLGALLFGVVVGWASVSASFAIRPGIVAVMASALALAFIEEGKQGLLATAIGAAIGAASRVAWVRELHTKSRGRVIQ